MNDGATHVATSTVAVHRHSSETPRLKTLIPHASTKIEQK